MDGPRPTCHMSGSFPAKRGQAHRPTRGRGLTSPRPVTALPPAVKAASEHPGKNLWISRRNVNGKKTTPTANLQDHILWPGSGKVITLSTRWIEDKRHAELCAVSLRLSTGSLRARSLWHLGLDAQDYSMGDTRRLRSR